MKLFILLLLLLAACGKNPLGDSGVDPGHSPLPPNPAATLFTHSFDFSDANDYNMDTGIKIEGGSASLIASDSVDDATGVVVGDLNFSDASSASGTLSIMGNQVAMTSGATGTYISRIIDGMSTATSWSALEFRSSQPFGKELSTTPETGYGSAVTDFSNQLVGLWHLNETSGLLVDAVGGNDGSATDTTYSEVGVFDKAISFDGSSSYMTTALNIGTTVSISVWATAASLATTPMLWRIGPVNVGPDLFFYNGVISLNMWDSDANPYCALPATVTDGNYHHYVVVINGLNSTSQLYYDGALCGSATYRNPSSASFTLSSNAGYDWNGKMDELAIWDRPLSASEAAQLYRRGANRLKFQVRTCTDSACVTNPSWIGTDGTSSTYLTEVLNQTTTPFKVPWADLAGFSAGFNTWFNTNKDNRYIQYKAIFESDTAAFYPDITYVSYLPQPRYSGDNLTVTNKTTISTTFKKLTGVAITESACSSAIHYAIGNSATNFLSWSGSVWVNNTNYANGNSKVTLEALSSASWDLYPEGTGALFLKVYLPSDGLTTCAVDQVTISGTN